MISIQSDHKFTTNGSNLSFESKSYIPMSAMVGNPNFKKSGITLEIKNILEFCLCLCSKGKKIHRVIIRRNIKLVSISE